MNAYDGEKSDSVTCDMLQFCVFVVPPTLYLGVTLVLSDNSGYNYDGKLYLLILQLPFVFFWIRMSVMSVMPQSR